MNTDRILVDREFKKLLKKKAIDEDKTVVRLTKDLANSGFLIRKDGKKKEKMFDFF